MNSWVDWGTLHLRHELLSRKLRQLFLCDERNALVESYRDYQHGFALEHGEILIFVATACVVLL